MSDRSGPEDRLTLCSASYRSKACLELSWELTARLNPSEGFTWLVVENTDGTSSEKLSLGDERFTVIDGVPPRQAKQARGSYQHAAALNKALAFVESRFVLFLDPDFFLVRPGWIRDVLNHMVGKRLSFFGAPYHPARHTKYRYFPHQACLAVDLQRVPKQNLDFTPEIDEVQAEQSLSAGELLRWLATGYRPSAMPPVSQAWRLTALRLLCALPARRALMGRMLWPFAGMSRDGGYRIYRRYARDPAHRSECVTAVWREAPGMRTANAAPPARLAQWLDGLLVIPRRRGYFSRTGFRELGAWDAAGAGWEEYLWRSEPFGFHVQGLFHGLRQVDNLALAGIVRQFAAGEGVWPTLAHNSPLAARPAWQRQTSALNALEGNGQ